MIYPSSASIAFSPRWRYSLLFLLPSLHPFLTSILSLKSIIQALQSPPTAHKQIDFKALLTSKRNKFKLLLCLMANTATEYAYHGPWLMSIKINELKMNLNEAKSYQRTLSLHF